MSMATRSGNPALPENLFYDLAVGAEERRMTIGGTANKAFMLLGLLLVGAGWTWHLYGNGGQMAPWMIGGLIGGLVLGLVIAFKPTTAPYLAWAYAAAEGLFLGGLSAILNSQPRLEGIVIQALVLTLGVLAIMLVIYRTGLIKVTSGFMVGVMAATGAVALFYLVSMLLSLFGVGAMREMIHGSSTLSIGISVVVVIIASLNLLLDFEFIRRGSEEGAPRHMEWYGAFALLVTLVWLYIEILRLLAKLRER